jgi:putative endonuclease
LDLVFREGGTVVFVEVRYRTSNRFGDGLASVTARKQRRLINAAASWLQQNPGLSRLPCRFDVVSVSGPVCRPTLNWVRAAFGTS